MLWLDAYERGARLAPGLLALLAVASTVTALGLKDAPVVSVVLSVGSLAGGPLLLAAYVRNLGLKAQSRLWADWGGSPTTIMLRTRGAAINRKQRDAWRQAIERVTGVTLSSARAEQTNPTKADEAIDVAVGNLRERTRGSDFSLLASENRNYGFERNFYGIRWVARVISVLGAIVVGLAILWRHNHGLHPVIPTPYVLGGIADFLVLMGWLVLPSKGRTRTAADKYAYQLLQAAVSLNSGGGASTEGTPASS